MKTTTNQMTRTEADLQMALYALHAVATCQITGQPDNHVGHLSLCREIASGAIEKIKTPLDLGAVMQMNVDAERMN